MRWDIPGSLQAPLGEKSENNPLASVHGIMGLLEHVGTIQIQYINPRYPLVN
jgi:hypothetical protein